jgi:hypothetical protein
MLFNAHIVRLDRGGGTAGRQDEPLMITRIMLVTLLVSIYSLQGQTQQIL